MPLFGYDQADMPDFVVDFYEKKIIVWLTMSWMMIAIPIGALISNLFFKNRSMKSVMQNFKKTELRFFFNLSNHRFYLTLLVGTILLIIYNLITLPDTSALSALLNGGSVVEGQKIRRNSIQGSGIFLVDIFLNISTLSIFNLMAFIMAFKTCIFKWRILFLIGFISVTFFYLSNASMGNFIWYVLSIGIIRSLMGGKFIKVYEGFFLLLFLGVIFSYFKGYDDFSIATVLNKYVGNRIVFGQIIGTYFSFEVFPLVSDYLWFSSTGRAVHNFLDSNYQESYGIVMMNIYNPSGVLAGTAGHFTTNFMGEAWANFGILGIIFAPLWVGIIVQILNRWLLSHGRNIGFVAIYGYMTTSLGYATDFIGFYYPLGYILQFISFVIFYWIIYHLVALPLLLKA